VAANLAVVRKIAPRLFVKHLWLAALESGAPSQALCPSCGRPLLALGPEVEISPSCKLCCRCFLVWFDQEAATFLRVAAPEIFPALRRL
jgi:predicted amidophosphoribosyltransferase